MRQFSSYGPIDTDVHYYSPRDELIQKAITQLIGHNPEKNGHYITKWALRQTGKTWIMQQAVRQIKKNDMFEVGFISLQSAKTQKSDKGVLRIFIKKLKQCLKIDLPEVQEWDELSDILSQNYLNKPLILIIDEFDAIDENFINKFANEFRDMHISRQNEVDTKSQDKFCLLHGLALI